MTMTDRQTDRQSCMTMRERERETADTTDRCLWPKEELTDLDLAAGGSVSSVWRTFPTH